MKGGPGRIPTGTSQPPPPAGYSGANICADQPNRDLRSNPAGPAWAGVRTALLWVAAAFVFASILFLLRAPAHPPPGADSTLLAIQAQACVEDGWCNTDGVHQSRVGPPHGALWHYFLEVSLVCGLGPDEVVVVLSLLGALSFALLFGLVGLLIGWRWAAFSGLVWLWFWDVPPDLWNPALMPWLSALIFTSGALAMRFESLPLALAAGLAAGLGTQSHLILAVYAVAGLPLMARAVERHRRSLVYVAWALGFVGAVQMGAPTLMLANFGSEGKLSWLGLSVLALPLALLAADRILTMKRLSIWMTSDRCLVTLTSLAWIIVGALSFLFGPEGTGQNDYYYVPAKLGLMVGGAIAGHRLVTMAAARLRSRWFSGWRVSPVWPLLSVLAFALVIDGAMSCAKRRPPVALSLSESHEMLSRLRNQGIHSMDDLKISVSTGPELMSFWWNALELWRPEPEASGRPDWHQDSLQRLLLVHEGAPASPGWEPISRLSGEFVMLARTEPALLDRRASWTCVSHVVDGTCQCRPLSDDTCEVADSQQLWPLRWKCLNRNRVFRSLAEGDSDLFMIWPFHTSSPKAESWTVPPLDLGGRCPGFALGIAETPNYNAKPWSHIEVGKREVSTTQLVSWYPIRSLECAKELIPIQQDVPMPIPDGPPEYLYSLWSMPEAGIGPPADVPVPAALPDSCIQSMAAWQPPVPFENDYPNSRPALVRVSPAYVLPTAFLCLLLLLAISAACIRRVCVAPPVEVSGGDGS